jgi:hypothetical protein
MANDSALFQDRYYQFAATGIPFFDFDNRITGSHSTVNSFRLRCVQVANHDKDLALAFIVIRIKLATKIEEN